MSTLNKPRRRHCLLVAHGSRLETSNEEIRTLATLLCQMSWELANVDCAFLEIAKPSIDEGLRRCIALGADEIVVVPYFLSSGRHVSSPQGCGWPSIIHGVWVPAIPAGTTVVQRMYPGG